MYRIYFLGGFVWFGGVCLFASFAVTNEELDSGVVFEKALGQQWIEEFVKTPEIIFFFSYFLNLLKRGRKTWLALLVSRGSAYVHQDKKRK